MYDRRDKKEYRVQRERETMKKRMGTALAAAVLAMGLAGCGENKIPPLTDEQIEQVGEFTAITLMRYDANHRSRLVDYSLLLDNNGAQTPEGPASAQPTQTPVGMDPVEDTPVIGPGEAEAQASLEETLGLPETMSVSFAGHALYDTYPEGENDFVITAAAGKKLLALQFDVKNASDTEQAVDLIREAPVFRITVNGNYTRRTLLTGLPDDLSTFSGTVPAGGSLSAVLLIEVNEETAGNISSISLNLKNGSMACTVQLL